MYTTRYTTRRSQSWSELPFDATYYKKSIEDQTHRLAPAGCPNLMVTTQLPRRLQRQSPLLLQWSLLKHVPWRACGGVQLGKEACSRVSRNESCSADHTARTSGPSDLVLAHGSTGDWRSLGHGQHATPQGVAITRSSEAQ